jgi:Cu/Zn superoxide dismutase
MRIILFIACASACGGGGGKKQVEEAPPPVVEKKEEPPPAPEPEPEPPKTLSAKAALTPVKGAKMAPGTVTFTQTEGQDATVTSEFSGLKKGTYHLVIHEGTECGPNATKAGPAWKGGESVKLSFQVGGDAPGNLDESGVKLMLGGAAPIVGQTLVLHDDKKGAPGKAMACGTIDAVGGAAQASGE